MVFKDELKDMERPVDYRYMLVYAYDKRMNEDDEVSKIRAYAKSKGLRIVSPGFFHKWADCNVSVDPIGLLRYFKFADCIVTDTFHGSVMSIITHREFAVILRDNSNKLFNILEEYALEDRVLSCDVALAAIFDKRIDYGRVDAEVGCRRNASMDYLRRMIEE